MQVFVFEDQGVDRLGVLTAARPACDLTIGSFNLCEALTHLGHVRRVVRPFLTRHIEAVADSRVTLWGAAIAMPADDPPASRHGAIALAVNARAVPSRATLQALRTLVEAGHRGIVRDGEAVAAAVLHRAADGTGPDDAAIARLLATGSPEAIEDLVLPTLDCSLEMLREPHDVITAHEHAIAGTLAMRVDGGGYREIRPGLFVAEGAQVAEQVVARHGPVVVAANADVGPFVCLDGPAFIGPQARINPHAWIHPGTAIGAVCRVGGEVEATVMEPFSNKPHDGFLGHSHVGSWVNLAAGTVTSNLKATYGTIRLHEAGSTIDTGRQFFGALFGDLAKTAINASIPCGARIGVAATVGTATPEVVPAFTNQLLASRTTPDQAAVVLERMMARRGLASSAADRDLLAEVARG
jgi:UDP-N-acetylglucosamine diphosphorylase/glucosamine-1-phosphate N-acetyltransferase